MIMKRKINKELTFKKNAPFRSCIQIINNTFIDNIFMPLFYLLEYSSIFSIINTEIN